MTNVFFFLVSLTISSIFIGAFERGRDEKEPRQPDGAPACHRKISSHEVAATIERAPNHDAKGHRTDCGTHSNLAI
ncbi:MULTISPECIES: hypothetical protein [unclassified Bosea (in: a-proteobacteria)]|uniref:hypothetical protein n=1 Tax=unclassified Bosea (in: a-proteobacteria) TaxID=2653178 RepID=UPI000F7DDF6C|nr:MULTISPECIES: hypothetical protein [unclassified Bosea (in: a-proteobacteria)]